MRQADREEIDAISGRTPVEALRLSFQKSTRAWTGLVNGRPEVMFGAGDINILTGVGAAWLLGTDAVEVHQRRFLRESLHWRDQLFERYSVLRNFVDTRNVVSIRWLRWLGATFTDPVDLRGHAFLMFELRPRDV